VSVTWQAATPSWSVSLSASNPQPPVGATVTLTAMANQSVTNSGDVIRIRDYSSGYVYQQCNQGSTCQAQVPLQYGISPSTFTGTAPSPVCPSTGMGTCRYQAIIYDPGTGNVLASSAPVSVTWSSGPAAAIGPVGRPSLHGALVDFGPMLPLIGVLGGGLW
jgi:hypothetical protein